MRTVTIYPRKLASEIGDGEACDRCPRTVGRGRTLVRVTDENGSRVLQVCAKCATEIRRNAKP